MDAGFLLTSLLAAYSRFNYQLELHHCQSLPSRFSSTAVFPTWVNRRSSSVLDVFRRLDQYKNQLLSGVLSNNMDLEGSFETGPMSEDKRSLSNTSIGGLTMHDIIETALETDFGDTISSF